MYFTYLVSLRQPTADTLYIIAQLVNSIIQSSQCNCCAAVLCGGSLATVLDIGHLFV